MRRRGSPGKAIWITFNINRIRHAVFLAQWSSASFGATGDPAHDLCPAVVLIPFEVLSIGPPGCRPRARRAQTLRDRNFVALSRRADYRSAVPIMNVMS